ncbi:MAG: hypothetical protein ACE5H7_08715 [Acidiferrobacterales bacterium]
MAVARALAHNWLGAGLHTALAATRRRLLRATRIFILEVVM